MGTHTSESECEKCGGKSWVVEDTRYKSTEQHCLNENCRHYNVDARTAKNENLLHGVGTNTPEEWLDVLEDAGYKKCSKCGSVDEDMDDSSPLCEDCSPE